VGTLQRQIYGRLDDRGMQLNPPMESRNRPIRVVQSFARVIPPTYMAALVCATPAPFVSRVPVIAFVYDLRWQRTRRSITRTYRYLDLRHTVATADHIFAISGRTRDDLIELFPSAAEKSSVLHLGPGIVDEEGCEDGEPGTVLLSGLAAYKRNELIANALAWVRPEWARSFLCVGVSDAVFQTLVDAFGEASCDRFDNIDDTALRNLYRKASVYVTASMEEGFGLPMVEALAAGCQVVAIRQPLTLEILGEAGVLLNNGGFAEIGGQLKQLQWIDRDIRIAQASKFSWDQVADIVADAVRRLSQESVLRHGNHSSPH
jgi:mannosyltransferase